MADQQQLQDKHNQQGKPAATGDHEAAQGEKDGGSEASTSPQTPKPPADPKKKRRNILIGITAVVILLVSGVFWWLHARSYEDTDDAQIDGHLHPLSSRVDGTVVAIGVEDNQRVATGQLLVQLDPRDYQVSLAQAQASVRQAQAQAATQGPNVPITRSSNANNAETSRAQVASAEASLAAAQQDQVSTSAQLRQAQANNDKAQMDLQRYTRLFKKQEVSQSDYDQYVTTARAQAAIVEQQEASLRSSAKKVDEAQAQVAQQQSKLAQNLRDAPRQLQIRLATLAADQASADSSKAQAETAALRLGYTRIYSPVSGIVTQRSAELGGQITTGQQLLVVVQTDDLWVTANFRETQLQKIHTGQYVRIHVDSLGEDFSGYVEAMPAASGDRTSVLPPENATGNYVKVVQRLPVRIRFDKNQHDFDRLRPGMSVEPRISLD